MSVTFYIPQLGKVTEACPYCADAPGSSWGVQTPDGVWRCDPFCDGLHTRTAGPSMTLSNSTAAVLLQLAGVPSQRCYGTIKPEAFPAIARQLVRVLNTSTAPYVVPPSTTTGARGATFIDCGLSADRLQRTGQQLQQIIQAAAKIGAPVTYG